MRSFIVMGMFVAGFAQAGWKDFEEQRELSLTDVNRLEIKAGAGSMDINGVPGSSEIKVTATIVVPGASDEKARDIIEEKMVLSLEQHGDSGHLDAWFEESFMGWRSDAYIVLDIDVPPGTSVAINDGAGSIDVIGVGGDVTIDDGSGSIDVKGAAAVRI